MLNVILLIAIIVLASAALASAAPWVPINRTDIERMLKLANLKSGEIFYDLGCGDGRTIIAASTTNARAIGVEFSLLPYIVTWMRLKILRSNARVVFKNFFKLNLSDANVVYLFLGDKANAKLNEKFNRELKKGTRIISYVFPIPGRTPTVIDKPPGAKSLFLYIV